MRIKDKTKKQSPGINLKKAWRIPGAVLLLLIVFMLGYISHPSWNLTSMVASIKKTLIKTDRAIMQDIRQEVGLYAGNDLATVFLDIPFDSLITIEEKRIEALASGILLSSDDDFVPASMRLNDGDPFSVKIRLKGDWTDHLVGDKWSFRIHITDSQQSILGMRRFSIQAPETRNYEKEWIYHQNLIDEDLLTTRYYFVNVVQNGKFNGIYALEESFTEDLLESQGRREGPIIRFNEDLLWLNWENLGSVDSDVEKIVQEIGEFWLTGPSTSEITAFRQKHLSRDDLLSAELFTAIDLLYSFQEGLIPGDQVFDQELWGKYFALTDLWGSGHSTNWINLRFYFNPITGLLEPVVFDALPFEPSTYRERLAFPFGEQGFIQDIFRIPGVQRSYVENLERVTQKSYQEALEEKYGPALDHFHQVLSGYLERGIFGDIPPLPWDQLRLRSEILASNLESPQPIQGHFKVIEVNGVNSLKIDLNNLMVLPVEIKGMTIDDVFYEIDNHWCPEKDCQDDLIADSQEMIMDQQSSLTLLVPLTDLGSELSLEPIISVEAAVYGGSTQTINPLSTNYDPEVLTSSAIPQATFDHVLASHAFLETNGDHNIKVKPGTWEVSGDLILPADTNLLIPAGVTLLFETDAILLVKGSLNIEGTSADPVIISSLDSSWGGIVVLGDDHSQSTWTNAVVENTSGVIRGGWVLTGGITFYKNDLSLSKTIINNTSAEDALNIIRADFEFEEVEFRNTVSDAFDGDFTNGTISNCSLENVGGDGLDFSGSTVSITGTDLLNIGDKAVSVGEESLVRISESRIENTNIGIASKDLSSVIVDSVSITDANVAGLAAYIKKPQYGPASLNADQVTFIDTPVEALCQLGSLLTISAEEIQCQEIDVESLYDQSILGN